MNLSSIKNLLSNGEIPANQFNPIIDSLDIQDLGKLSVEETETLSGMICNIFLLIQDPTTGAHLDNPEKADLLLATIRPDIT